MKKLTKAQERALEEIRRSSEQEKVEESIRYYERQIERYADDEWWIAWIREHIERYKNGWVLVQSYNSRTLEVLAESGFIEYEKNQKQDRRYTPIDWARLVK